MKKLNTRGFGVIEGLLILIVVGIVGGIGFYVYNADKKMSIGNSDTNNSKVAHEKKNQEWKEYNSEYENTSFSYPSDWKFEEVDFPDFFEEYSGAKKVTLTSPQGFKLEYYDSLTGLGGACLKDAPNIVVTGASELKTAKGIYLVENGKTIALSNEITKAGETDSCLVWPVIKSKNKKDGRISFGSSSQFEPNKESFPEHLKEDVEIGRQILKSFKYQ